MTRCIIAFRFREKLYLFLHSKQPNGVASLLIEVALGIIGKITGVEQEQEYNPMIILY